MLNRESMLTSGQWLLTSSTQMRDQGPLPSFTIFLSFFFFWNYYSISAHVTIFVLEYVLYNKDPDIIIILEVLISTIFKLYHG